jgi:tetratricopeptide (TPR) repeat protein
MKSAVIKRIGILLCGVLLFTSVSFMNPVPISADMGSTAAMAIPPALEPGSGDAGNGAASAGNDSISFSSNGEVVSFSLSGEDADVKLYASADTISVTPVAAYFNKVTGKQADVVINLFSTTSVSVTYVNSVSGSAITASDYSVTSSTVTSSTITIKKEYLAAQKNGPLNLIIGTSNFPESTYTIFIGNVTYDPKANADIRKLVNNYVTSASALNVTTAVAGSWKTDGKGGGKYYEMSLLLEQAVALEPHRCDLLNNLGSIYVSLNEYERAVSAYERILQQSPNDEKALAMLAFFKHYEMNKASFGSATVTDPEIASLLTRLRTLNPSKADGMTKILTGMEAAYSKPVVDMLTLDEIKAYRQDEHVGILTLGNALNDDGTMTQTLKNRLEQTLKLATLLPKAVIVVTGGVPKANNSEGIAMKQWLIENGIDESRIFDENHSTGTTNNMLYSAPLLQMNGVEDMILISSGTHLRRSECIWQGVNEYWGYQFNIKTFAEIDFDNEAFLTEQTSLENWEKGKLKNYYSNTILGLNESAINLLEHNVDTTPYDPIDKNMIQWGF